MKRLKTGQKFRRGLGRSSLCRGCNSRLGSTYVDPYFIEWTKLGMELIEKGAGHRPFSHPFTINPGAIIRQVAAMGVALGHEWMLDVDWFNYLRAAVTTGSVAIPPGPFRFFVYLVSDGSPRLCNMAIPVQTAGVTAPFAHREVALPPFGYVIMHNDENTTTLGERIGFCDITRFLQYTKRERHTFFLTLRRLIPLGASPLDYAGVTATQGMA